MPNWRTFRRGDFSKGGGPQGVGVTVMKSGKSLGISAAAYQLLGLPSHVVLMFDPEASLIGIRAGAEGEDGAMRVYHRQVSAARLMRHLGLVSEHSRQLSAEMQGDILVISYSDDSTDEGAAQ